GAQDLNEGRDVFALVAKNITRRAAITPLPVVPEATGVRRATGGSHPATGWLGPTAGGCRDGALHRTPHEQVHSAEFCRPVLWQSTILAEQERQPGQVCTFAHQGADVAVRLLLVLFLDLLGERDNLLARLRGRRGDRNVLQAYFGNIEQKLALKVRRQ